MRQPWGKKSRNFGKSLSPETCKKGQYQQNEDILEQHTLTENHLKKENTDFMNAGRTASYQEHKETKVVEKIGPETCVWLYSIHNLSLHTDVKQQ